METLLLADPRGALGTPPVQFLSLSCSFWQKPCQIIGFCPKLQACLHVPSPCPSPSLSKYSITPMVTVHLMGRMGTEPILFIKWSVSIDTMINFDSDGDGTCNQAFRGWCPPPLPVWEILDPPQFIIVLHSFLDNE